MEGKDFNGGSRAGQTNDNALTHNNFNCGDKHQHVLSNESVASRDCRPTFVVRDLKTSDRDTTAKCLENLLDGKILTCTWCGYSTVKIKLDTWNSDWKLVGQRLSECMRGYPDVHLEPQTSLVTVRWFSDSVTDEWLELYFTNPKKTSISSEAHVYIQPGHKTALIEFVKATGLEIATLCNKSHYLDGKDVTVTPWFCSIEDFFENSVDVSIDHQPSYENSFDPAINPQPFYENNVNLAINPQLSYENSIDLAINPQRSYMNSVYPAIKPQCSWPTDPTPPVNRDEKGLETNVTELMRRESEPGAKAKYLSRHFSAEITKDEFPIYALIKKAKLLARAANIDMDQRLWSADGTPSDIRETKRIMTETVANLATNKQYKALDTEVVSFLRKEGGEERLEKILEEEDITASVRLTEWSIEIFVGGDLEEAKLAMSHLFQRTIITEKIPWDKSNSISTVTKDIKAKFPVLVCFSESNGEFFMEIQGFRSIVSKVRKVFDPHFDVNKYVYDRVTGAVLSENPNYNNKDAKKNCGDSQLRESQDIRNVETGVIETISENPDVSQDAMRSAKGSKSGLSDNKAPLQQTEDEESLSVFKKTADKEASTKTGREIRDDLSEARNSNKQLNKEEQVDVKARRTEYRDPIWKSLENENFGGYISDSYRSPVEGSFHLLKMTQEGQAEITRLKRENNCLISVFKWTVPGSVRHDGSDVESQGAAAPSPNTPQQPTGKTDLWKTVAKSAKKLVSKKSKYIEVEYEMKGCRVILTDKNITECQADVLVNTISKELSFSSTVAKEFLKKAGKKLKKAVKPPVHVDDVIETGSFGMDSMCTFIFHAVLPRLDDVMRFKIWTIIGTVLTKVFQSVSVKKRKSLALPAIGCGKLGFPGEVMAHQFLRKLSDQLSDKNNSIKVITLSVCDTKVFTSIKRYFDGCPYDLVSTQVSPAERSNRIHYGEEPGLSRDGAICFIQGPPGQIHDCKQSLDTFIWQVLGS